MKRKGLFITGTDTDVGKTYITVQIIEQLNKNFHPTKVRKPIESGCALGAKNELIPSDGTLLCNANNNIETLQTVTPFRFSPAVAPNRAATLAHQNITIEQLYKSCIAHVSSEDFLIVEGAGGFYSPLCSDGLNADLATRLSLDIVLVINDKLGCINHTMLSLEAIHSNQLNCVLIVLNQSSDESIKHYDHFTEIQKLTAIPLIQCLKLGVIDDVTSLLL